MDSFPGVNLTNKYRTAEHYHLHVIEILERVKRILTICKKLNYCQFFEITGLFFV